MKDHWFRKHHILQTIDQLNASASGKTNWLEDPIVQRIFQAIFSELLNEGNVLTWKQEGLRDDVEKLLYLPSKFLHVFYILLEEVLSGYLFVADEVVDLLEEEEIREVYLRFRPSP